MRFKLVLMTTIIFSNMYGTHPRLTLLDQYGDAAGILFLNSAAQVFIG